MAFTKPTRFSPSQTQVASDGKDVSVLTLGEENFANVKSPLLETNNGHPKNHKAWGILVFCVLASVAIACFALGTIWSSSERNELDGNLQNELNDNVLIYYPDVVESMKGVVTSCDTRCSQTGAKILRRGGHAVDAAVATALCLGVVSPTESGIGGGSFMVIRSESTSKSIAIDMREVAPAAASENMYANKSEAQVFGPLSIAVPGELKGLRIAHDMYGRLPWKDLFEDAIDYARNGSLVSIYLANDIKEFQQYVLNDTGLREVFAPNGTILKANDICYNKKLADTLEAVAEEGPQIFYTGRIGKRLVEDVHALGGILTEADLMNYQVNITDVLTTEFMGFTVLGMPPPSSGTVGITMVANVMSLFPKALRDRNISLHRMIEALKHELGMRMHLGDPAFVDISKTVAEMISLSFAHKIKDKIFDNTTFPPGYYVNRFLTKDSGTNHLSVVDSERNAVALTTSVNDQFGSKILSPSTGIVINNQMRDFATPTQVEPDHLPPTPANYIRPGKRPLSSMSPLILLKGGKLAGVIGGSGGMNIPAAVAQVFLSHFYDGVEPRAAVHNPRVYPQLNDTDVDYDNCTCIDGEHIELPKDVREFLETRHHVLEVVGFPASCHLIVQDLDLVGAHFGMLTALGDPRKNAKPAKEDY